MDELQDALQDGRELRGWEFRLPRRLEHRFREETDPRRNRQLRFWTTVVLVFSWMTLAVDLVSVPDVRVMAVLARVVAITPASLLAIRLLDRPRRGWVTTLASVVPPALSILTVWLLFAAAAIPDTFRAAIVLSLGVLWVNVLVPMRVRDALLFSVTTMAIGDCINIASASLHHVAVAHPDVVAMTHLLVAISVLARWLAEQDQRRSFVLGLGVQMRADDLARSNARLLELSNTDPLTGLANRRHFELTLARACEEAAETGSGVAVMMIDIDYFKQFNDTAGHLDGDRCLAIVARAIGGQVREGRDLAARLGGEEFVVLMPATDLDTATEIAERVHTAIGALREPHPGRPGGGFVSVSIGVAAICAPARDLDPAALLAAADEAMYAAKTGGRNRVVRAGEVVAEVAVAADTHLLGLSH